MDEIREPFGFEFFKPVRHGKPSFSRSSSKRTRASLRRNTKYFSPFMQLPFELRTQITSLSIEDAGDNWREWRRTQDYPVQVLQSRRGILRVQPQHKQPPSLAQLACVSKEWQEQIEKQLFKFLKLKVLPDSGPDECSDLVAFSAIVTGPRRRFLSFLQLGLSKEHQTNRLSDSQKPDFRHTDSIMRLLRILGTWSREQVSDHLLWVELRIKLQDSPSRPSMEEIKDLPTVPVIGQLDVAVDHRGNFSNLPLALHCLVRKLPELKSVVFYLSHWSSLHETDRNYKLEGKHYLLLDGLHSAAPQLKELQFTLPENDQQPYRHRERDNFLTGIPVLSILKLSYSLQRLMLDSTIDLSLFFKYFHNEAEDIELMCPSWPVLEFLELKGSIVKGNDLLTQLEKDWFLKVVGRAARRMPKLQCAVIELKSTPSFTLDGNWMMIIFETNFGHGKSTDSEGFLLSVGGHTPSSSAVSVWKDTLQRTKRLQLVVEFNPAPYYDEAGALQLAEWQVWKEY